MTFLDFLYKVQFNLYTSNYSQSTCFGVVSCTTGCRSAEFSFTTFGCAADRLVAVLFHLSLKEAQSMYRRGGGMRVQRRISL